MKDNIGYTISREELDHDARKQRRKLQYDRKRKEKDARKETKEKLEKDDDE